MADLQDVKGKFETISLLLRKSTNRKLLLTELDEAIASLVVLQEAIPRGGYTQSNFAAGDEKEAWVYFQKQLRVTKPKALRTRRGHRDCLHSCCLPMPTASEIGMKMWTRKHTRDMLVVYAAQERKHLTREQHSHQKEIQIAATAAQAVSLDWPLTRFGFFGHCATYTRSFCVFGPGLSSPARGPSSLAMAQRRIEVVFVL
jgi:hypothetical protein